MSNWQKELTAAIGQRVKDLRGQRTAVWLSETTEKLGMKVSRSAISELESGKRRSISVAEWLILAAALEVPPILLLFPNYPDGLVDPLPDVKAPSHVVAEWFSGRMRFAGDLNTPNRQLYSRMVELVDEREQLSTAMLNALAMQDDPRMASEVEKIQQRRDEINKEIAKLGGVIAGQGDDDGEG